MSLLTTYLETRTPPVEAPCPLPANAVVIRAAPPTTSFYRWIYHAVGSPWRWTDRDRLSDDALAALVTVEAVHILILYLDGTPAGYAELAYGPFDGTDPVAEGEAQLVYFGLMPHVIGKGLGRAFLEWTVREAFAHGVLRLWVHTCSDDHPRALSTYEAAGFVAYRVEESPGPSGHPL